MQRVYFDDLRLGDVGFVAGEGLLSRTISRLTARDDLADHATPSHAFVICSRTQVIEALEKTRIRPLAVYAAAFESGRAAAFRPAGSLKAKRLAMQSFVQEYLGADYAWLQILGFLPVLAARTKLAKGIPNPLNTGEICSEIALLWLWRLRTALQLTGQVDAEQRLEWTHRLDRNTTDPALLLACCLRDSLPERI